MEDLLAHTAELAGEYIGGLSNRPVIAVEGRNGVRGELPDKPIDALQVIEDLVEDVGQGLVASAGPRYFGFVTGGAVPAAVAADWLVSVWDQNSFSHVASPAAAAVETIAAAWILELLGLPSNAGVGFVTGCQMAHVTALSAARHRVSERVGWSIPEDGLREAPPINVVTGELRHSTVDRALRLLGMGSASLRLVEVDHQGRLRLDRFREVFEACSGPTIVVAQAGEVNTGAFDPVDGVAEIIGGTGAWLHVDGAFGLWVRASTALAGLAQGVERADSWAFDAHKWLNVPYDCGVAVVADAEAHAASMAYGGDYLVPSPDRRDAMDWVPDASRRARGIPVYAAIRSMGRQGISELVERCCQLAGIFADGLSTIPGAELLTEPVVNQVLFRFETDARTTSILDEVQRGGVAWLGPTRWHGRTALRLSVSNWSTTEDDIMRTLGAFSAAAS